MKLSRIVNAHLACDDMGKERMPYRSALAIWEVFTETESAFRFFIEEQRKLLEQKGRGEITEEEFQSQREKLLETEKDWKKKERKLPAPTEIKPMTIEALKGFIQFQGGK